MFERNSKSLIIYLFLPQHLHRVNLINEIHLLNGMLVFLLLPKPNWALPFLILSLCWMVKVKHIPLTETETKVGVLIQLQKDILGKPVADYKSRHDTEIKSFDSNLKNISGCFLGHIT